MNVTEDMLVTLEGIARRLNRRDPQDPEYQALAVLSRAFRAALPLTAKAQARKSAARNTRKRNYMKRYRSARLATAKAARAAARESAKTGAVVEVGGHGELSQVPGGVQATPDGAER